MAIVTYSAMRDTGRANATDEDRAMAHAHYYSGAELSEAQAALYVALHDEAQWLTRLDYYSARSLRKAADMVDAANNVDALIPEAGKPWSRAHVETAGIVWSIVRTERAEVAK